MEQIIGLRRSAAAAVSGRRGGGGDLIGQLQQAARVKKEENGESHIMKLI